MTATDLMRALRPHCDEVVVPAGEQIAVEGRLCHQFFVVVDGVLETCRGGMSGELGAGDHFGWEAMRARGINEASVRALTSARLLVMGHAQFRYADARAMGAPQTAAPWRGVLGVRSRIFGTPPPRIADA